MSVYKWNSKIDYLEKAKTLAFNGEIEFLPESLVGLDLSHYYDDYPDLKELIGEKQYIDFNDSEQQQKVYDFIQNNSALSDMVYADWLHDEATSREDQLACEYERENCEYLGTILELAALKDKAVVGIYDHDQVFFTRSLQAGDLVGFDYDMDICFERKNPLYEQGSDACEHINNYLAIKSFEYDERNDLAIHINADDNHENVNIDLVPFRYLVPYMEDHPEFKEDLIKVKDDFPEIQETLELYNINLEKKNNFHL